MRDGGAEEDHDGGEGRGAEARIERGEQNRRRERNRERREHRDRVVMRNERADRAGVDGAAQGAEQIVGRRLERPADIDLGEDDGGEHGPECDRQVQQLRRRQGEHRGRRAAYAQPQLRAVVGAPCTQLPPTCCQMAHGKLLAGDSFPLPRLL